RITDFVGIDRNSQENPHGFVPHSRIVSRRECLELAPGVWEEGLTGGAIWHDAQVYNSERLTLSFLLSADEEGAAVANYVEVTGFLKAGDRLVGAEAKDVLS
ncbi:MAG: FAD-dependent oxidoreductase, partial [Armatimonadetes bacterium]|nr:FAD-dependent oxidoreductase [Armatimonadota bacterium]NIM66773.1 FAD-dependent oxidoreductase [Armatimonadota bacterium]NIT30301.1 FAD-dependent oxidoreductase [Armatimonadota bacterium]